MNLLYVTVKALLNSRMDNRLIRCIYELRTMTEQGLCPQLFQCAGCGCEITGEESCFFSQELHGILCESCARGKREARRISPSALYAMRYIATAPWENYILSVLIRMYFWNWSRSFISIQQEILIENSKVSRFWRL
mgnify:FL=1